MKKICQCEKTTIVNYESNYGASEAIGLMHKLLDLGFSVMVSDKGSGCNRVWKVIGVK